MMLGAAVGGVQAQPGGSVTTAESSAPTVKPLHDLVTDTSTADARPTEAERTDRSSKRDKAQSSADKKSAGKRATQDVTAKAKATAEPKPDQPPFPPVEGCLATHDAEAPAPEQNGQIDDSELCEIGHGHRLRPDAAAAFAALSKAFEKAGGGPLIECVTDSYRSYELQVDLKLRKPVLAAPPGTSNHGWGVAVDFACGMESYGSNLYAWLTDHGPKFGWTNPEWASPTGSKPEPWHWEFDPALLP